MADKPKAPTEPKAPATKPATTPAQPRPDQQGKGMTDAPKQRKQEK